MHPDDREPMQKTRIRCDWASPLADHTEAVEADELDYLDVIVDATGRPSIVTELCEEHIIVRAVPCHLQVLHGADHDYIDRHAHVLRVTRPELSVVSE